MSLSDANEDNLLDELARRGVAVLVTANVDELAWPGDLTATEVVIRLSNARRTLQDSALQRQVEDATWSALHADLFSGSPASVGSLGGNVAQSGETRERAVRVVCAEIAARACEFFPRGGGRKTSRQLRETIRALILDDTEYRRLRDDLAAGDIALTLPPSRKLEKS
ncbi:MAG: hypothetical protein B7Z66_07250 [Chromatiales bacterium 21-64-14]|nr:MAG: hypothetical protein B7Z66_07250 [Chromatiales bacterium 21-64-14]